MFHKSFRILIFAPLSTNTVSVQLFWLLITHNMHAMASPLHPPPHLLLLPHSLMLSRYFLPFSQKKRKFTHTYSQSFLFSKLRITRRRTLPLLFQKLHQFLERFIIILLIRHGNSLLCCGGCHARHAFGQRLAKGGAGVEVDDDGVAVGVDAYIAFLEWVGRRRRGRMLVSFR